MDLPDFSEMPDFNGLPDEPWINGDSLSVPMGADSSDFSEVPDQNQPPDEPSTNSGGRSQSSRALDAARASLVRGLIGTIRQMSSESDRDEVLRWFVKVREILGQDAPRSQIAKTLYKSIDVKRFAKLMGSSAFTTARNYKDLRLPLAIKVALPITAVGTAFFGLQGAGLVAFGGGIGTPVVLLLFLGVAGVTSVIEAFAREGTIRDPLTKLLITFVAFDTARRVRKDLADALRAEAVIPERSEVPLGRAALKVRLLTMDPIVFERHVMSFFQRDGHTVGLTPVTNDFGVDGFVDHPDGLIVVQCKRYAPENPVGRPAIQHFKGVIEEQKALKGYFVTTSRFTSEASESAKQSTKITLVDGDELLRWHELPLTSSVTVPL